jgi:hypothetical protein
MHTADTFCDIGMCEGREGNNARKDAGILSFSENPGVRYRGLHAARGKSGNISVRCWSATMSQAGAMFADRVGTGSSERLLASVDARLQKDPTGHLSVHQLAREIQRQMGTGDYAGSHETLPVGQASAGRPR